jgi:hypothetical protein
MERAEYSRQIRSTRKEAVYLFDHILPLAPIAHERCLNELRRAGFVAALLNCGPADYAPGLRQVVRKCPAIKLVPRERSDVRRLDLLLVSILLNCLGILSGNVECDLRGAV